MNFWTALYTSFLPPLKESIQITVFVTVMMVVVEYISAHSHKHAKRSLNKSLAGELAAGAILGVIPGCIGSYATVSLYSRKVLGFGSLLAMLIATTGDESFLMLARFPLKAVFLMAGLAVLGIVAGMIAGKFFGKSFTANSDAENTDKESHAHSAKFWDIFWHIAKSHALKIFLWTYCVMVAIECIGHYVDVEQWIVGNKLIMIIIASLVGFIPQSGPHMIFVTMFAEGILPFPVLLANCISQDGHACLPLIAEDKKSFVVAKLIKFVIAIAAGYLWMIIF